MLWPPGVGTVDGAGRRDARGGGGGGSWSSAAALAPLASKMALWVSSDRKDERTAQPTDLIALTPRPSVARLSTLGGLASSHVSVLGT